MSIEQPGIKEVPQDERRPFDLGEKFVKNGGKVLEWYADGTPRRWKCGRGEKGEIVDPQGMKKEAIRYFNAQGECEGKNPDEESLKEIKLWRSDWMD